jgi:TRAP-type uncharacterized transport system substrate-binding protein
MNQLQFRFLPGLAVLAALLLLRLTASYADESASEPAGLPPQATGADIVFSAGRQGGGYWGVAERLRKVAAESGLAIAVRESVGSVENLNRLSDPEDPVNLTLTQSDALKRFLQEHPGLANKIEILESIGLECVFIVASADSGIENDQDLQSEKGYRLGIPSEVSGVAVTFDYMTKLVPGLANTSPVYGDTMEAMRNFGQPDAPDAVMLVHRPKLQSPELQMALDAPERYKLIPVEDRHLADKLPSGEAVYDFLDIPLIRAGLATDRSLPTVCTKGTLIASKRKMTPGTKEQLSKIIDFQWMRIYPTAP